MANARTVHRKAFDIDRDKVNLQCGGRIGAGRLPPARMNTCSAAMLEHAAAPIVVLLHAAVVRPAALPAHVLGTMRISAEALPPGMTWHDVIAPALAAEVTRRVMLGPKAAAPRMLVDPVVTSATAPQMPGMRLLGGIAALPGVMVNDVVTTAPALEVPWTRLYRSAQTTRVLPDAIVATAAASQVLGSVMCLAQPLAMGRDYVSTPGATFDMHRLTLEMHRWRASETATRMVVGTRPDVVVAPCATFGMIRAALHVVATPTALAIVERPALAMAAVPALLLAVPRALPLVPGPIRAMP